MADTSILQPAVHTVPDDYPITGTQQLAIRSISGAYDGSAAATFVPAVQILDGAGNIVGTYPLATTVAAGASADVSWFPGLGGGSGSGGGDQWALIGTGSQTNLAAGALTVSIQNINTNAPGVFSALFPLPNTTFHDTSNDGLNNARWSFGCFQLRNAALDVSSNEAWHLNPVVNPVSRSVTVGSAGELVYALTFKAYIRLMTAIAPYTLEQLTDIPSFVSGGHLFAFHAGGQGPGVVNWSATLAAADLVDPQLMETIMIGFKAASGTPTEVGLTLSTVTNNPVAVPTLPAGITAGDILMLWLAIRAPDDNPTIATPAGWSLMVRAPDRTDPNWGGVDNYIYLSDTISNPCQLQIAAAGVYELQASVRADDAAAAGRVETTMTASGGSFSTWDGGNYIISDQSDGTTKHWRANSTKILSVTSPPVTVSLTLNNRTGSTLGTWEAGIFARQLSGPVTAASWDL